MGECNWHVKAMKCGKCSMCMANQLCPSDSISTLHVVLNSNKIAASLPREWSTISNVNNMWVEGRSMVFSYLIYTYLPEAFWMSGTFVQCKSSVITRRKFKGVLNALISAKAIQISSTIMWLVAYCLGLAERMFCQWNGLFFICKSSLWRFKSISNDWWRFKRYDILERP